MAKAVLLNGYKDNMQFIELPENQYKATDEILRVLNVKFEDLEMFNFGYKYIITWQNVREEATSAELTVRVGFAVPYFIRSKAVISKFVTEIVDGEEISTFVDVDMEELEKHFNMNNAFWALRKLYVNEPIDKEPMTEDEIHVMIENSHSDDDW